MPVLVTAQENTAQDALSFYVTLAKRDALNEQHLILVNAEDHKDFWSDQHNFENLLEQHDPQAHAVYLKSKGDAYRIHQKVCTSDCEHTEQYLAKATFYTLNGQEDVVYALKIKKPQIKD